MRVEKRVERVNNRISGGEKCMSGAKKRITFPRRLAISRERDGREGEGKNISAEKAAENYTFPAPPRFLAT